MERFVRKKLKIKNSQDSGGTGIGSYTNYAVATEGSEFSVPENFYGFFPDNANLYLLSKLNQKYPGLGTFLALTGSTLTGSDLM
jgi:enoyl-CoA hydratase/carnithine racemase